MPIKGSKSELCNQGSARTAGLLRRHRSWDSPAYDDQDSSLNIWLFIPLSLFQAFTSNTANKWCQVSFRLLEYSFSYFKVCLTFPLTSSPFQPISPGTDLLQLYNGSDLLKGEKERQIQSRVSITDVGQHSQGAGQRKTLWSQMGTLLCHSCVKGLGS